MYTENSKYNFDTFGMLIECWMVQSKQRQNWKQTDIALTKFSVREIYEENESINICPKHEIGVFESFCYVNGGIQCFQSNAQWQNEHQAWIENCMLFVKLSLQWLRFLAASSYELIIQSFYTVDKIANVHIFFFFVCNHSTTHTNGNKIRNVHKLLLEFSCEPLDGKRTIN